MRISNSKVNNIVRETLDSNYGLSEKKLIKKIFNKLDIFNDKDRDKYRYKIQKKIDDYYDSSSSDSTSSLSDSDRSLSDSSLSSDNSARYHISDVEYPKKKMTIAEKKKFCRKHGLIYDKKLDKEGKAYCRKDRRGRKKKKKVEEKESEKVEETESEKESEKVEETDSEKESGKVEETESEKESEKVEETESEKKCNLKEDGKDLKCGKDKVCNVTEKKCIPKKEEMEIYNINGYEVIGDKYIIEKLQKILKSDNEFDIRKKGINDIRKCFGLSVYDSD